MFLYRKETVKYFQKAPPLLLVARPTWPLHTCKMKKSIKNMKKFNIENLTTLVHIPDQTPFGFNPFI